MILVTGGAGFIGSNFVLDWLATSDEPVVNLDGTWRLDKGWEVIGRVNNLFDRRYDAHAVLGTNFFRNGGFDPAAATAEQFRSPGSPRGVWLGLRYAWSGK